MNNSLCENCEWYATCSAADETLQECENFEEAGFPEYAD